MANTFVKIASVTVGSGGASSIAFTSIPATFTDLCVLLSVRSATSFGSGSEGLGLAINNTYSGYSTLTIFGNGSSATSYANPTYRDIARTNSADQTANVFSNVSVYIPNYTSTTNKSVSTDGVAENNGTTALATLSAFIQTVTVPITSLYFDNATSGGNYVQYSTATLYGIKNS
jgi:hypothetical protein